jgi:hypothetical protein
MAENGITVRHVPDRSRFQLVDGDAPIGTAYYKDFTPPGSEAATERIFYHTVVDEAYGGQGLGGTLASTALKATVDQGLQIVAVCPYIKAYTGKHHDFDGSLTGTRQEHLAALPREDAPDERED